MKRCHYVIESILARVIEAESLLERNGIEDEEYLLYGALQQAQKEAEAYLAEDSQT
jgi:hypothetical protein